MALVVLKDVDGDDAIINTQHVTHVYMADPPSKNAMIFFTSGECLVMRDNVKAVLKGIQQQIAPVYGVVNDED